MNAKDMMHRIAAGLKGSPPKDQGPVGDAVEVMRAVIDHAKKTKTYDQSTVLKSCDVLLDYTHNVTGALAIAVDIINAIEEPGEWSPIKIKVVHALIQKYKLQCVKARMHQYVPGPKNEPKLNVPEANA